MQAGTVAATTLFADRLAAVVARKRSQLVVGLDPRPQLLPVELRGEANQGRREAADACTRFCCGIVDAVAPHVVGVKPQLAFFEALGADGGRAFEEVCEYARAAELIVIADGKRGDVASTARAYAAAYLDARGDGAPPLADALTVNPYIGEESLEPFLAACRRSVAGIFCVVKTSNGAPEVQDVALSDGRPLWQHIARLVAGWGEDLVADCGLSSVGAVVGATHPREVGEVRRIAPQAVLLLPGIGAQGARPADVARAFTSGPSSALVAVSRSIAHAFRGSDSDWRTAAGAAAARLRREVWTVSGW